MTKQQRFFSRPSSRTLRPRPRVLLDRGNESEKRRAVQEIQHQNTDRMAEGVSGRTEASTDWSAEQLERIWQHTTG